MRTKTAIAHPDDWDELLRTFLEGGYRVRESERQVGPQVNWWSHWPTCLLNQTPLPVPAPTLRHAVVYSTMIPNERMGALLEALEIPQQEIPLLELHENPVAQKGKLILLKEDILDLFRRPVAPSFVNY